MLANTVIQENIIFSYCCGGKGSRWGRGGVFLLSIQSLELFLRDKTRLTKVFLKSAFESGDNSILS